MTTLIALPAQNNFGDTVPDGVAGPLGLFITLLLVIATVLLIRNMNKHLRRLPERFPSAGSQEATAAPDEQAAPPAQSQPQ